MRATACLGPVDKCEPEVGGTPRDCEPLGREAGSNLNSFNAPRSLWSSRVILQPSEVGLSWGVAWCYSGLGGFGGAPGQDCYPGTLVLGAPIGGSTRSSHGEPFPELWSNLQLA